jgi:cyclophilin family peptidyl-prolyl cis-trans isomerase
VSFAPSDGEAAPPATPREPAAAAAPAPTTPTHVFLDIAKQDFLKDPFVGKVVVELYTQDAPRTTYNFAELCRDKKYVNTPFHRIIKDFMVQGGDLVNQDGTGTYSVYGGEGSTFADEAFVHAHDRPGLLSMANSGPNTNGSQFFITTAPAPHLDGKHVVFGRVVEGMEHVHDVEREVTDPNDRPIRRCYVMNCGVTDKPTGSTRTASEPLQQTRMAQSPTPPAAQALQTYGSGGGGSEMPAGAPTEPVPFQL